MKCLVSGVYFLEFAQSALITRVEWRVFVTGFGNVETVDQVDIIWLATPIFTAIGELSWIGGGRLMFYHTTKLYSLSRDSMLTESGIWRNRRVSREQLLS
jgi:hypothetical protein